MSITVSRVQKTATAIRSRKNTAPKTNDVPESSQNVVYNDIEMKSWKDYDEISTDSLWMMNSRDRSGGHELVYHGNCIPQILTQLLTRFTKKGDTVIDLFLGSGTTAIESERLGRHCIGVELSSRMVDYVSDKLKSLDAVDKHAVILGNSQDHQWTGGKIDAAIKTLNKHKAAKQQHEQAQFLFLHPPYDDIIRFSENPHDLSNQPSTEAFMDAFRDVASLGFKKLQKGRFAAVVIGDKYANKELVPLGFLCMEIMNEVGFRTKSIIVKNITGNERGKGKAGNLWRYRALKGGFYVFKHEYVLLFEKP